MSRHHLNQNRGTGNRHQQAGLAQSVHGHPSHGNVSRQQVPHRYKSHGTGSPLPVQQAKLVPQHFPFQPLPPPNGQSPFRFDLSQLLHPEEIQRITQGGTLARISHTGEAVSAGLNLAGKRCQHDAGAGMS